MFVFYLVILNIVFNNHYLYCGNCCESCKCCCCSSSGPNNPGNPKGKPTKRKSKNDVKVLQCSNYDYDTLQREFQLQNFSFVQDIGACWLTSCLLAAYNSYIFQKAIKEYKYDGKQEHYYLKIIQDLFNDMQTKQGVYDVDFNKYYSRFIKDGEINHKRFYTKNNDGGFSNSAEIVIASYILNDIPCCSWILNMFPYSIPVDKNLIDSGSFKKQLNEFLLYSPPLYILNIVLNNIVSNYLSKYGPPKYIIDDSNGQNLENVIIQKENPLFARFRPKCVNGRKTAEWLGKESCKTLVLLAEKDIIAEFEELRRCFIKKGCKFFKSSKNGSMDDFFAEMKQKMDKYTYVLDAVICGTGHNITVVKDNKNNKTYDLQPSSKGDGLFSREITNDFLDPENFCFLENTTCKKCRNGNCKLNHYSPACSFLVSVYRKNN